MDKCYLCRGQKKKAKLLAFGYLCHKCLAIAKQVVDDFGLAGYAMAIAIVKQVRTRDYNLERHGTRFIGSPLYWNQRKRK